MGTEISFPSERILYEDNHLIIINKQAGELVQGDKTGDKPLSELLKSYLKKKYNKPGEVFLGVTHRIDRPVSGLVIFAKTSKALERMNEMFREKKINKKYWAVVQNKPDKEEGILVDFLTKNEVTNKSYVCPEGNKNASRSELEYKLILQIDRYYLLEINPLTGRHHQIRVQLSAMGSPIKGDVKYGFKRSNPDASIHLHARSIEFMHPVKNENLKILADPPNDPVWNAFMKQYHFRE
jgi:23S rRNA pseudouridine1911/1915/1917 synthase